VKKRHSTRRETRRRARPPAARALTRVRIRENENAKATGETFESNRQTPTAARPPLTR
jgi:hypothetical protein